MKYALTEYLEKHAWPGAVAGSFFWILTLVILGYPNFHQTPLPEAPVKPLVSHQNTKKQKEVHADLIDVTYNEMHNDALLTQETHIPATNAVAIVPPESIVQAQTNEQDVHKQAEENQTTPLSIGTLTEQQIYIDYKNKCTIIYLTGEDLKQFVKARLSYFNGKLKDNNSKYRQKKYKKKINRITSQLKNIACLLLSRNYYGGYKLSIIYATDSESGYTTRSLGYIYFDEDEGFYGSLDVAKDYNETLLNLANSHYTKIYYQ